MDRGVWRATVPGVARVRHDLQLNHNWFIQIVNQILVSRKPLPI